MTRPLELYCPFDGSKLELNQGPNMAPRCSSRIRHTFDIQFSDRMNEMATITFRELV